LIGALGIEIKETKMYKNKLGIGWLIIVISVLVVACGGNDEPAEAPSVSGAAAMVDGVTIDFRNNHYYAVVTGTYSDACTRISDIEQEVSGEQMTITLTTAKPADLMCAQMITPFGVDLLLEIGGLIPGEYLVEVNGISTTFTLGE
jgi:hypothetical protein